LTAFFWANKTGQHDDTHTPSIRMLFDDEDTEPDPDGHERQKKRDIQQN